MISERLKDRELISDEAEAKAMRELAAKDMLESCVRNLVSAMMLVEDGGDMTRTETEDFVLAKMGFYEKHIYSMDSEDFHAWLVDCIEEDMAIAISRL